MQTLVRLWSYSGFRMCIFKSRIWIHGDVFVVPHSVFTVDFGNKTTVDILCTHCGVTAGNTPTVQLQWTHSTPWSTCGLHSPLYWKENDVKTVIVA
uniref:Uncharacterized protein n=1 Tax=Lutzomyia longipalpis TaxID=7200 RepID=A0A1B0CFM5_LUTLO